jgi:hypothetical protein
MRVSEGVDKIFVMPHTVHCRGTMVLPTNYKEIIMLKVTYVYKTLNEQGEREIESVQTIRSKNYSKYVAKAREYNSDLDNELYISQVKDCSQTPNHTTCLTQVRAEKTTNDFNIRARDLKYSNVGNNPWDNVYLIPTLEF